MCYSICKKRADPFVAGKSTIPNPAVYCCCEIFVFHDKLWRKLSANSAKPLNCTPRSYYPQDV